MLIKQKDLVFQELKCDSYFSQFDDDVLERFSEFTFLRKYATHQVIYFPYEPSTFIYLVHKGRVRITKVLDEDKHITFRHAIEGDYFGEEGMFEIPTRDNFAEAILPSEIWVMHAKRFKSLLTEIPYLAYDFSKRLYLRTIYYESSLLKHIRFPIMARLVSFISSEVRRPNLGEVKIIKITHQEIANLLGARRETISACLKEMEDRGFIEKRKGSIIVKDIEKMERWCERNYLG